MQSVRLIYLSSFHEPCFDLNEWGKRLLILSYTRTLLCKGSLRAYRGFVLIYFVFQLLFAPTLRLNLSAGLLIQTSPLDVTKAMAPKSPQSTTVVAKKVEKVAAKKGAKKAVSGDKKKRHKKSTE